MITFRLEVPLESELHGNGSVSKHVATSLSRYTFSTATRAGSKRGIAASCKLAENDVQMRTKTRRPTYGWLAPPSKNEPRVWLAQRMACRRGNQPDWERAVIKFFGPITQHTRQPGSRQFCAIDQITAISTVMELTLVSPSIIITESLFTSSMYSAEDTDFPKSFSWS